MLYRLCTGSLPFNGPNTMAVLMALGTQEPTPVRELNPQVPEALAVLIHQLLAKKAEDRPQSVDEVVKRLRAITKENAARQTPLTDSQPTATYVPLPVTAVPEANPFADIRDDDSESSKAVSQVTPAPKRAGKRRPWVLAAVGLLALAGLTLGGVLIIIIKNKDGTETKIEVPDDSTITVKGKDGKELAKVGPEKTKPPVAAADPDPKAAEWVIAQGGSDRKAALYVLSLGGSVQVNDERLWIAEVDAIMTEKALPREPFRLTVVNVFGKRTVTTDGLAVFKDCKHVTTIWAATASVSDGSLAHFKNCENIGQLNLHNTPVTDAGLAHFKGCKSLKLLCLGMTKVSDDGLAHLKECEKLSLLLMYRTPVTDAGLTHLNGWKQLSTLELHQTQVTDVGLARIADCKKLTKLTLGQTKVTAKGVAALAKALPGCKIEWDGGVIEPK